jgi:hypothetical protein
MADRQQVPTPQIKAARCHGFRIACAWICRSLLLPQTAAADPPTRSMATAWLTVSNSGTRHIRYTDFIVMQAGRKVLSCRYYRAAG